MVKNNFGSIHIFRHKRKFDKKTIAISMSGGIDSSMLCFLAAKHIKKAGLKSRIQPYNGFDKWAPNDSIRLPCIINFIRNHFPEVIINDPLVCRFDTQGDQVNDKNTYIQPFIESLLNQGKVDVIMNGISLGPALDIQRNFPDHLPFMRRPGFKSYNEIKNADPMYSPFMHVDKRFVVACYKKYRCEDLLALTHSCTHYHKIKCNECWWCNERSWAIKAVFGNDTKYF